MYVKFTRKLYTFLPVECDHFVASKTGNKPVKQKPTFKNIESINSPIFVGETCVFATSHLRQCYVCIWSKTKVYLCANKKKSTIFLYLSLKLLWVCRKYMLIISISLSDTLLVCISWLLCSLWLFISILFLLFNLLKLDGICYSL